MKTAKELYKDKGYWYDYQPMLEEFGEILVQVDEDSYQGDSYLLYKRDNQYGFLIFGWGSCSGCDALQSCDNIDEVQELMNQLYSDIKWFDSLEKVKKYLSKDAIQELKYYYNTKEFKQFKKLCQEVNQNQEK